jgi:hypothetical protein
MSRSRHVACRVTSGMVAPSMLSGGVARVLHVRARADGFVRLGRPLHFVTLGEQDAVAGGGHVPVAGVPDPFRTRLHRSSQ